MNMLIHGSLYRGFGEPGPDDYVTVITAEEIKWLRRRDITCIIARITSLSLLCCWEESSNALFSCDTRHQFK